jgi:MYXO-CTERM domain-containing protein
VFVRNGTTWTEEQKLLASDGVANDSFGSSLALSDDRAMIGAFVNGDTLGAVYVFLRSGTTWSEEKKFTLSSREIGDYFGGRLTMLGDRALITASGVGWGAAYLFSRNGTDWLQEREFTARVSPNSFVEAYGSGLALTPEHAFVGAYKEDTWRGAAYVYDLNTAGGAGAGGGGGIGGGAGLGGGGVAGASGTAGSGGVGGDDAGGAGGEDAGGAGGDDAGGAGGEDAGGAGQTGGSAPDGGVNGGTSPGGRSAGGAAGSVGGGGRAGSTGGANPKGGSSSDESGCDCRMAKASSSPAAWPFALGLLLAFGARRRRA